MLAAYTLVCLVMLGYWVNKTWQLRRQQLVARRGWLVPVGIVCLWFGLQYDTPALMGGGIALALIGEYWPGVRPRRPRRGRVSVGGFARWQAAREPARPDIELHLEESGARVHNIAGADLSLHGWSPADQNGWLQLRSADGTGQPVKVLRKGESARLSPWPIPNRGVRVWYTRADAPDQQWLFRADWNDVNASNRELN